ncbi:Folate-biopterin transporter 1, chloroplastic, partial [Mucuna pruriens]
MFFCILLRSFSIAFSDIVVDSIVCSSVFMLGFFGLWRNCELLLQWIFDKYIWSRSDSIMFYFTTNSLDFTLVVLGRVKLVTSIASLLGVGHYNGFMKNCISPLVLSTFLLVTTIIVKESWDHGELHQDSLRAYKRPRDKEHGIEKIEVRKIVQERTDK